MTIKIFKIFIIPLIALTFFGCTNRLHRAIYRGDVVRVRELLDNGANPNNYVYSYTYPLLGAVGICDIEILKLLLDNGVKTTDNIAELALRHTVDFSCDISLTKLLLENGVDPNANYYLGGTVLMGAVERGDPAIVNLLLDKGADPNLRGRRIPPKKPTADWYEHGIQEKECKATALMLAVELGSVELVTLLLEHGAEPNTRDQYNCTALKIARQTENAKIAEELIRAGARE